jgi:hypothetical protein
MSKAKKQRPVRRVLNARRDSTDFRALMFEPTLVEVPTTHSKAWPPIGSGCREIYYSKPSMLIFTRT